MSRLHFRIRKCIDLNYNHSEFLIARQATTQSNFVVAHIPGHYCSNCGCLNPRGTRFPYPRVLSVASPTPIWPYLAQEEVVRRAKWEQSLEGS